MRRAGVRPSVCPVDQLPLSGSDVQSVCHSTAVDRCRRQSAAAAIVIRCDPRDEDRHRLVLSGVRSFLVFYEFSLEFEFNFDVFFVYRNF